MKGSMTLKTALLGILLLCAQFGLAQGQEVESAEPVTINVNRADAESIAALLDGVGLSRARAIVEWRTENGEFSSLEDLVMVKGVGEMTLERNRDKIVFK